MFDWRVLIPIGIAAALWVVISRGDVTANLPLPTTTTAPCHPTAAEVAATEIAQAALPTMTPVPKSTLTPTTNSPVVTTELVVLAEDRDVPQLIPSLVIRAPAKDEPAISQLLSTALSDIKNDGSPRYDQRMDMNVYRTLLKQLLTNENDLDLRDDIGVLDDSDSLSAQKKVTQALGVSEAPLLGVGSDGIVTLVIPQTPQALGDNSETFAGGWTVNSSGRLVTFRFDGQPEAKTAWNVRVCTDNLRILSTSLITIEGTSIPSQAIATPIATCATPVAGSATPIAGSGTPVADAATPVASCASPAAGSATPIAGGSHLKFQNPNNAEWTFPVDMEPVAVEVASQVSLSNAIRLSLLSGENRDRSTAVTILLPTGLMLLGALGVLWFGVGGVEAERARNRLVATAIAVMRLAIAAALFPFFKWLIEQSRKWDAKIMNWDTLATWDTMITTWNHQQGHGFLPDTNRLLLTLPIIVVIALIGLGILDRPWPRVDAPRQWVEEFVLGLAVIVLVVVSFIYLASATPLRDQSRMIEPILLIAAFTMFLATGFRLWWQSDRDLKPWRAMALPAIGAVSVLICSLRWEIENRWTEHPFFAGGVLPLLVTVCVVVGLIFFVIALLRDIRQDEKTASVSTREDWWKLFLLWQREDWRKIILFWHREDWWKPILVRLGICAAVALVIVAIFVQWGWAIYSKENIWWRLTVESDPLINVVANADTQIASSLKDYPSTFLLAVVDLLFVLGLLGFVAVLHAAASPPPGTEQSDQGSGMEPPPLSDAHALAASLLRAVPWESHPNSILWMLVAVFAAFVIGYGGQVLGLRAPAAFLFGLVLLRLTISHKLEEASKRIDADNGKMTDGLPLIVEYRGELLSRALSLINVKQQLAKTVGQFTKGDLPPAEYQTKRDDLNRERESLVTGQDLRADQKEDRGEETSERRLLGFFRVVRDMKGKHQRPNSSQQAKSSPHQNSGGESAFHVKLTKDDVSSNLALGFGPKNNWWENGIEAVRSGAYLAIVPIAFFVYVFVTSQEAGGWSLSTSFAIIGLVTALTYEVAFWLVAAFSLGSLFPFIPGHNGPVKGAVLAAVYIGAHAGAALIGIPGNALWQVRSFQLLLFLMLLGTMLDLKTVEAAGLHWRDLMALYDLPNTSTLITQVLPLVASVIAVVGQLLFGQTQAATENLIVATRQVGDLLQNMR